MKFTFSVLPTSPEQRQRIHERLYYRLGLDLSEQEWEQRQRETTSGISQSGPTARGIEPDVSKNSDDG